MARATLSGVLVVLSVMTNSRQASNPCSFNSMCSCQWGGGGMHDSTRDIVCLDIPLAVLPDLPHGRIAQVDIAGSGLAVVESEPLARSRVESLRLMGNSIKHIDDRAFSSMSSSLTSLDLAYNRLDEIPFAALHHLRNLQWINLIGNQIRSIHGDWSHMKDSLSSLLVGENDLIELCTDTENGVASTDVIGSVSSALCTEDLKALTTLNVDGNRLTKLNHNSIPPKVQTLGLSHNLLTEFPVSVIENLSHLLWLDLRGNHIHQLPIHHVFRPALKLEKFDLGENELRIFPRNMFNNSFHVRDMSLDFNHLETLPSDAFRGFKPGRIILNHNDLTSIHAKAFGGLENSLDYLDLEYNKLAQIPSALGKLRHLKYLYLSSNMITEVPEYAFASFSSHLRVLSMSGNFLTAIPSDALTNCTKMSHLNLGYNQIFEVREDNFVNWADNLDTLLLRSNRISNLEENVFNLTTNLRELSLSFNPLNYIHPDVFKYVSSTLESLEMSFSLAEEMFPTELFKPLSNLLWLAIDNNNIENIPKSSFDSLTQIQYINLESNKISKLESGVFKYDVHQQLTDLRFSNNKIDSIDSRAFSSMTNLQSVSLFGNKISVLKPQTFHNLTNLVNIGLSDNILKEIQIGAFSNLPILTKLELQNNNLYSFSMEVFKNVSQPNYPLSINLSANNLYEILSTDDSININSLDLSFNNFQKPPKEMLERISSTLRRLHLSNNKIDALELEAFGPLENLELLNLKKNYIDNIKKHAFVGLDSLQVLDLSHNDIEQLHVGQFSYLQNLRVLDLSFNRMHYLSKDVFRNTKIEILRLSHNGFTAMPATVLSDISMTLRNLQLDFNNIEHIDSTMFPSTPFLLELDLSHNRINLLPDNVFTSLGHLQKLDLGYNPLRANFKELFHYAQSLKELSLANIGMKATPTLPLPNLVFLNLSSNGIEEVTRYSFKSLQALRHLVLSHNQLKTIPSHVWNQIPILKILELSNNPIKEITSKCFYGLNELQELYLHSLNSLDHFDPDALTHLRVLTSFTSQTSKIPLRKILSPVKSLRKISIEILESNLSDQLQGVLNDKLKYVDVWGQNLKVIEKEAFIGLENTAELLLRIRDSQVEELPVGLIARFHRVPQLRLDLRNNQLGSLTPDVFYNNNTSWESVGTKLVAGGILLDNNPWSCDCRLVWLGHWLRRWLRESIQLHAADAHSAQAQYSSARAVHCTHPQSSGKTTPLVELRAEYMACHASALSNAQPPSAKIFVWLMVPWTQIVIVSVLMSILR